MGQKSSPLALRTQNNFVVVCDTTNLSYYLFLRKIIKKIFFKKGLLINEILIKDCGNTIKIFCTFIPLKIFYTQKNRRLNKRQRGSKKFTQKKFLKLISVLLNKKIIFFVAKSLISKKNALNINKANSDFLQEIQKNGIKLTTQYFKLKNFFTIIILLVLGYAVKAETVAFVLANYFAWLPKRQHKKFFIFLRNFFFQTIKYSKKKNSSLKGIKFAVGGRLSGKDQADVYQNIAGNISAQKFNTNIDYALKTSYSKLGTFGWKIWLNTG